MKFILDNNLSPVHAQALDPYSRAEGCEVHHLRDKFDQSGDERKDEYWLPALSKEGGWIVVSGDIRIFKNPQLRKVWIDSKLTTFFLAKGWTNIEPWDQGWRLMRWWPQIIAAARLAQAEARFEVPVRWGPGRLRTL